MTVPRGPRAAGEAAAGCGLRAGQQNNDIKTKTNKCRSTDPPGPYPILSYIYIFIYMFVFLPFIIIRAYIYIYIYIYIYTEPRTVGGGWWGGGREGGGFGFGLRAHIGRTRAQSTTHAQYARA